MIKRPVRLFASFLLLFIAGSYMAPSAMGALGNVTGVTRNGDTLDIEVGSDKLIVQVCGSNLLRVDYQRWEIEDDDTQIIDTTSFPAVGATMDTASDPMVITTDDMTIYIDKTPCRFSVYDAGGSNLLIKEQASEGVHDDGVRFDTVANANMYGIESSDSLRRDWGGSVYAGSQGHAGAPFAWSTAGFGVLVDSDGGDFNIGSSTLTFYNCSKSDVEFFIAVGNPHEIMDAIFEVTGKPPMFPKWAMGFHNTEWGIDQSELISIVNTYRSKEIPIDSYILDFDWKAWGEDNYGEWRWNTSKFPDGPSGSLKSTMDAQGIKLGGIMKPRIHYNTQQGNFASVAGYWWPGKSPYNDYFSGQQVNDLNFALADCRDWFFDHIKDAFDTGIIAWWNDEADAGFDNWQFMNMQKGLYEGQRDYSTKRVWSINRNFYMGSQRYAYALWTGDIGGGFGTMAGQRPHMLSSINSGCAKWGMDIGGFNADPGYEEYARWMQFGAFCPVYRVHGSNGKQRQPWHYGPTAEARAKEVMQLRYQLIPYIYAYERQAYETGVGQVWPLLYDYPNDSNVANYYDAWMFGHYLLVAPVVDYGQTSKNIYLPAGTWIDYFRGDVYTGGQTINYTLNASTWEDVPLFIKKGAIIPTQPVMNYVGEKVVSNIYVDVFADAQPSAFSYYDDDGETYDYELGVYFKQVMTAQQTGGTTTFQIASPEGSYTPDLEYYICSLHNPSGSTVRVNGASLPEYADMAALETAPGEGWAAGTDVYGDVLHVKVAGGVSKSIVVSDNSVATPILDPPGGIFTSSMTVTMTCETVGATIRYTTDGSDPSVSSSEYTAPVTITTTTVMKARGFEDGMDPSGLAQGTYTWVLNKPDISVLGLGAVIANGDTTPSTLDRTDFGSVALGSHATHTFTILNDGVAALVLTNSPLVEIQGTGAAWFDVTTPPPASIAAQDSVTFSVQFTPTSVSNVRDAEIVILSNDEAKNPYAFSIRGTEVSDEDVVFSPSQPSDCEPVTVMYRKSGSPLQGSEVYIHIGWNAWEDGIQPDVLMQDSGDYWTYEFNPTSGMWQIDCVFRDENWSWDNNGGQDWHVSVTNCGLAEGIIITDPGSDIEVGSSTTNYSVSGVCGPEIEGHLQWENALTSDVGTLPAASSWTIENIPLAQGSNVITVTGSNSLSVVEDIAADDATDTEYQDDWDEDDNGGYGFGPWMFDAGSNAGHYLAGPASTALDIANEAWGMWANGGSTATAIRALSAPLAVSDRFSLDFENGFIDGGSTVGLALLNAAGEYLFELYFVGGQNNYLINDEIPGRDTGFYWSNAGIALEFTLTSTNTYELQMDDTILTGTLVSRADMEITEIKAWNGSAGYSYEGDHNVFLNDMKVSRPVSQEATVSDTVVITRTGGFVDTDGDGIDDDYEMDVFGDLDVADATSDWDKDGMSDRDESYAGTHPKQADSVFEILSPLHRVTEVGLEFIVTWSSVAGNKYDLYRSWSVNGDYEPIASGIGATPDANTYTDTVSDASAVFYKVKTQHVP